MWILLRGIIYFNRGLELYCYAGIILYVDYLDGSMVRRRLLFLFLSGPSVEISAIAHIHEFQL